MNVFVYLFYYSYYWDQPVVQVGLPFKDRVKFRRKSNANAQRGGEKKNSTTGMLRKV